MSASFLHGMYNGAAFNIATINIQLCGKAQVIERVEGGRDFVAW